MDPVRWKTIKAAFQEAMDLPEEERAVHLDRIAAGDPEVRREVEALLRSDAGGDTDFLDPPEMAEVCRAIGSAEPDSWIGRIVGRYRLVRRIGAGGMGAIFLATRVEQYEERVAVKLIKRGMDTESILSRFRNERQTLANLTHPHIARLLDGGATEDGAPYLVMEYIEGLPIDRYCDERRLAIPERLRLFQDVCAAVEYAHRNQVVHRDLKPSNILVTEQAGRRIPKVIDFGIAMLIAEEEDGGTTLTRAGQILGSPRFMSPEQADPDAKPLDHRADVYSLGVILYHLLVGELPYDRVPTSAAELLRMVEDLPNPSTRIQKAGSGAAEIAERRRTDTGTLRRQIRGDLDWITRRALERNRERRYASAADLSSDLDRYLRDEPVLAGPPSARYRLAKLYRRNKVLFLLLAAMFLSLLTGSILSGWWFLRADGLRRARASVAQLADRVQSHLSQAHLWLEEGVGGDESIDVEDDVYSRIERARALVDAVRQGERTELPSVIEEILDEAAAVLSELSDRLGKFRALTEERWTRRATGGETGGQMDQDYDDFYREILELCERLRSDMQEADLTDWRLSARTSILLNVFVLLLFAGAATIVLRRRSRS